jgi:xylulose-5-phosphate/fructose-6-phosphate phosphoketolase
VPFSLQDSSNGAARSTRQDPGFLDVVMKQETRDCAGLPATGCHTLLSTYDRCLRSRQYVSVVVAGKQPALSSLSAHDAELPCARGVGIGVWAGTEQPGVPTQEPDVVLARAGDIPTLETLAAAALLRQRLPQLVVRMINVVDLLRLTPDSKHPHGLPDNQFDALFTTDRPVIFAFHGYPHLVHQLTSARHNHDQIHVHGYQENGTTTTFVAEVRGGVGRLRWRRSRARCGGSRNPAKPDRITREWRCRISAACLSPPWANATVPIGVFDFSS